MCWVIDAKNFGVSHRAHASVEAIAHHFDNKHRAAGFLLQKEIEFFAKLIKKDCI